MASDSKELSAKWLEGKVALITGSANGIGAATARLLARHGARLVLADIDDEGRSLASTLGGSAWATYIHCDVTDEAQVAAAVDGAVATYGHLDIVYANAGIIDTPYKTLDSLDLASFERIMAVNVTGVFLTLKHAARVMKAAGHRGGSVVVAASISSVMAGITPHAYTCSKHALLGLVRNAAAELGMYGIRVNAVSPSALASKQSCTALGLTPQELEQMMQHKAPLRGDVVKPLRADDIAEAVLFLSCGLSKYISGHNLVVDGGITVTNSTLISGEQFTDS